MKRILALLLVLCTCLPLVACGGGGTSGPVGPGTDDSAYTFIDNVGDHNFGNEEFVISALQAYERDLQGRGGAGRLRYRDSAAQPAPFGPL